MNGMWRAGGLLGGLALLGAGSASAAPLTRVDACFLASAQDLKTGIPVSLEGQVGALLSDEPGFYLLQETRAVRVVLKGAPPDLKPGQRVKVQGLSAVGTLLPWVREATVEVRGAGVLPKAKPVQLRPTEANTLEPEASLLSRPIGMEEGAWVQFEAVIRELRLEGNRLCFAAAFQGHVFRGWVNGWQGAKVPSAWLGGRFRLEAICQAAETRIGTNRGFSLLVPDVTHFVCRVPGPEDPFQIPRTSIREFLLNAQGQVGAPFVRVEGVVTRQRLGASLFIQDEGGSLFVRTEQREPLELGDRVEVIGFPSFDRVNPCLSFGAFRCLGAGEPPKPQVLRAEEAGEWNLDGTLVELEGRLLEVVHEPPFNILVLSRGSRVFDAILEQEKWDPAFDRLKVGSLLKVTGICIQKPRGRLSPAFYQIGMRSRQDARLVAPPPWWTRAFAVNLLNLVIGIVLLGAVWVWTLHRRVKHQTRRILQDHESRRKLEADLQQAQKMESVGMLAGGVAHDFNNLLTVIQNYVGLAQAQPDLSPKVGKALESIQGAAQKAANLTRQLLTFGRRQVMQMQSLDLNEAVSRFSSMLRRIIGEPIELEFSPARCLPQVHADPGMLEQVLMNLVVNARDAMPKGGRITLRTYVAPPLDSALSIHERVCLEVRDTGEGIPEEILPHIFEPFYTTKERGRGTGLGLATVHAIVEQHQGQITVESQLGRGTCFRFFLPVHAQAAAPAPEAASPVSMRFIGHERILLVEDDADLLQVTHQALESLGYRVTPAASASAALSQWEAAQGGFELLITDLVMPGELSGIQLAETLLERKPSLKVILSTGYSEELLGAQGQDLLRRVGFLPKPYAVKELSVRVREQLDRKRATNGVNADASAR